MSRIAIALSSTLLFGFGCAWVELSESGEKVRVLSPAEVASCQKLGATHSKTSTRAGIFARRHEKVDEELDYLARDEAAQMGGDTIVPQGPTTAEGRRSYDVYRCLGSY